jgi:hypothetical protein
MELQHGYHHGRGLGVLASGDNRLRPKLRNRFVTAFGVVDTIAADAGDNLIGGIWSSRHGSIGASPVALSFTSIARISSVAASMPR